ncbi:interferon-induced helicase C domain-containing protein 1-like [Anomaloglossus baeobatrachus]|uniref:interferon-induced helicase C domain-containing protein 1-like n=1 Tax=Anomaloglossus baeobatrachus TaxID=238106 RepID=UPI003F505A23
MEPDNSEEIHVYMIEVFRSRICSNIMVIPVLDNMHSLDQEFKDTLRAKAAGQNQEAARMLLDRILREPRGLGWFEELVTALGEAECSQANIYLSLDKLPSPQEEDKHDHCKKLISLLWPTLIQKLEPNEMTERCLGKKICTEEDAHIINRIRNQFDANRELLSRITKKKDWFQHLVDVLHDLAKNELITELTGGTYEEFIEGIKEVKAACAKHTSQGQDDSRNSKVTNQQTDRRDVTGNSSIPEASCPAQSDLDVSLNKSVESPDLYRKPEEKVEHRTSNSPVREMTLRDYQMEVAKPALDGENIVICLPTGSGKTRVAVYIARRHLDERKEKNLKPKVIVLVNKVPLVEQHYRNEFHPHMKDRYSVTKISGDCQLKISFPQTVMKNYVIICTAQILENSLIQAEEDEEEGVKLSDFSLLIIDECHHTQKGDVYNNIMIRYLKQKKRNKRSHKLQEPVVPLPQILGLTASPGVGGANNSKKAEEHILKICANLDSKIKTVQEFNHQLENQVKHPLKRVEIAEDNNKSPFGDKIKDMMISIEGFSGLFPSNDHGSQSYEQWVVQKEKTAAKEGNRKQHVFALHLKKYNDALQIYDTIRMNDALMHLKKFYDEETKKAILVNESEETCSLMDKIDETDKFLTDLFFAHKTKLEQLAEIKEYENEKLTRLRRSIMEEFTRNSKARGIIFTKTRQSAVALCQWIDDNEKFKDVGIRANYIIGAGSNSEFVKPMTQNEQKKVIHKFSSGEINLLIATSVAEEGLDIKECNIVIVYGLIHNEIAMVQTRGRARAEESTLVLVASSSSGAIDHDSVNEHREGLMHKAIQKVQKMDPATFADKIQEFQAQSIIESKVKKSKDLQKVYQKDPSKITFQCKKCQKRVCSGLDIRVIENMHHVVTDPKFKKRYKKGENKTLQEKLADYQTNGDIICNNCGRTWGTIMVHKGTELPCLKICNFVINYKDEKMTKDTLDVWRDLPIKFPPFRFHSDDESDDD